jgi:predicted short-subunit dehydrogenase-like oxidoreductase (DUF2520 family)
MEQYYGTVARYGWKSLAQSTHPDMLPAMARKPKIAIVGPGRLGTALALDLTRAGYTLAEIISRNRGPSLRRGRELAKLTGARASTSRDARLQADLIWFCVPDREIAGAASELAPVTEWKGKIVFHSSGALGSDELGALRRRGATVASVHPLMTFVARSTPSLRGVPFGVEGDRVAASLARRIAADLGGEAFDIRKQDKPAYHAWGALASPLLVAALVTAEKVAHEAGVSGTRARGRMLLIVMQTIANYAKLGPAEALSGPLVRGDAETIGRHLRALKRLPEARDAYKALSRAAVRYLPVKNRRKIMEALKS